MANVEVTEREGLKLGLVRLDTGRGFITGMASVVEELLTLLAIDMVLLGVVHQNAKGQSFLSLIGRCSTRARGIDLNAVLGRWHGGGHPAAAAASLKLCTADSGAGMGAEGEEEEECPSPMEETRAVMEEALRMIVEQVPPEVRAAELMTKTVTTIRPSDTMEHALALMNRMQHKAMPVMEEEEEGEGVLTRQLLGMLKYRDVVKAAQASKGQQQVKAWMRRDPVTVFEDTPFTELEEVLMDKQAGRLHVVDREGRLLGLVTRTDILRQHKLYSQTERRVS